MKQTIEIQNLKCGGCANTITKELSKLQGIRNVVVNEETSVVEFEAESPVNVEEVYNKLAAIGYPVVGEDNSTMQKAKSYVSCMIGRVS